MKLSTTTGDFKVGSMHVEEQIAQIAKTGFKHINLELTSELADARLCNDDWEERIEAIGKAMKDAGIDAVQAHACCESLDEIGYDWMVEETRRNIIACDRLGIPDLVVHPLYKTGLSARGIYDFNKNFYNDLIAATPDSKTYLLLENMADTECSVPGFASGYELADFLDWMGNERLGACLDTAHINLNKPPRDNQYESIIALGHWLRALHVSDNFGKNLHWHSMPFTGNINFDSVMCGLLEIGYKGAFNFEASYILRNSKMPPTRRKEWTNPKDPNFEPKLFEPGLEMKLLIDETLYKVGKYILDQYGVFEE